MCYRTKILSNSSCKFPAAFISIVRGAISFHGTAPHLPPPLGTQQHNQNPPLDVLRSHMSRFVLRKSLGLSTLAFAFALNLVPCAHACDFDGTVRMVPNPTAPVVIPQKVDYVTLAELQAIAVPAGAKDLGRMDARQVL